MIKGEETILAFFVSCIVYIKSGSADICRNFRRDFIICPTLLVPVFSVKRKSRNESASQARELTCVLQLCCATECLFFLLNKTT